MRLNKKGEGGTDYAFNVSFMMIAIIFLCLLLIGIAVTFGGNQDFAIHMYSRDIANTIEASTLFSGDLQVRYALTEITGHVTVDTKAGPRLVFNKGRLVSWRNLFLSDDEIPESTLDEDVPAFWILNGKQIILEPNDTCGFENVAFNITTDIADYDDLALTKKVADTLIELQISSVLTSERNAAILYSNSNFVNCRFTEQFESEFGYNLVVVPFVSNTENAGFSSELVFSGTPPPSSKLERVFAKVVQQ